MDRLIGDLGDSSTRPDDGRSTAGTSHPALEFESLETRLFLSSSVEVIWDEEVVRFVGSDAADTLVLRADDADGVIEFSFDGLRFSRDADPDTPGEQALRLDDSTLHVDLGASEDVLEIRSGEGFEWLWGTDSDRSEDERAVAIEVRGVEQVRHADEDGDVVEIHPSVPVLPGADEPTPLPLARWFAVPMESSAAGNLARGPPYAGEDSGTVGTIDQAVVVGVFAEAVDRWVRTGWAQERGIDLSAVQVMVEDLPGLALGQVRGMTIVIDPTAAGFGWFADSTPWSDEEFGTDGRLDGGTRFDLLTVMMHELGHVLGLEDIEGGTGLMGKSLIAGERRGLDSSIGGSGFLHDVGTLWGRNVVVELTADLFVDGDIVWDDQVIVNGTITVEATGTITITGSITGNAVGEGDDLTIVGRAGVGLYGSAGGDGLRNLSLRTASTIDATGATIEIDGDLSMLGESVVDGTDVDSVVGVLLRDTLVEATSVSIGARSVVTAETDGFIGGIGFDIASISVNSGASVRIAGDSRVTSAGAVDIWASSDVDAKAEAFAWAGVPTPDAAVATVSITSSAAASVGGTSEIVAGDEFSLRSSDSIVAVTTADGASASPAAVGGTWADTSVDAESLASIEDSARITAAAVEVSATSSDEYTTAAVSTAGGAVQNGPALLQSLVNSGARTSEGPVSLTAALGVTDFDRVARAFVATDGAVSATGAIEIDATSHVRSTTEATGAASAGGVGVGVAVAISIGSIVTESYVEGTPSLLGAAVALRAGVADGERHELTAKSTSGAGSKEVGVAGSLAIGTLLNRTEAIVKPGATVVLGGGLTLSSANRSTSTVEALASESGASGSEVGLGASVAVNIARNISRAEVRDGTTFLGVGDVAFAAEGGHTLATKAVAGGKSSGGAGFTGAVGVSVAHNDTIARLGSGPELEAAGSVSLTANHTGSASTVVKGDTESSSVGVGLSVAITVGEDFALATTRRAIDADGGVIFTAHSSGATSAEAEAGVAGGKDEDSSGEDVNAKATKQKQYADSVGTEKLGPDGGIDNPTESNAETSNGSLTVAGALAVNDGESRAHAFVPNGGSVVSGGELVLSASNNTDTSAKADGSTTGEAAVGVGVAVAINSASSETLAHIGMGATVSATAVRIEALMTDRGDSESEAKAESKSGAGSDKVGVAGSVAVNIASSRAEAIIKAGADVAAGGGQVTLTAVNTTKATTKALSSEDGASGGDVGVGASFAIAVTKNDTAAELRSSAALTDAGDLSLAATGSHASENEAVAGSASDGGVGVAGGVGISIANNTTAARLGDGALLVLAGSLMLGATHTGSTTNKAKGDTKSGSVGVGLSVGVTVANDDAIATTKRAIDAGGSVTFSAVSSSTSSAEATASAAGGKDEDSSSGDVDSKVKKELDHGDRVGTDNLGSGGGANGAEPPSAESSDGNATVAGALAVNVSESRAHAYVPQGGAVSAGGALGLHASNNTDSSAKADGSTTGDAGVGVGVAIGLNFAVSESLAYVGSNATIDAVGVTIESLMTDVDDDSVSESSAEATSGAGSDKVGVAGGLALNIVENRAEAMIKSGAAVDAGGGAVVLKSSNSTKSSAKALSSEDDGASGGDVGIGASFAIAIAKNTSASELGAGAVLTGVGDLALSATGAHTSATNAVAGGASDGGVGVAGAVGISIANNSTSAVLGAGTALTAAGSVMLSATHTGSTTSKSKGDTKSGSVGVGLSIAVTVANDDATATTKRSISAGSGVEFGAVSSSTSSADATASAEGGKDEDSSSGDVDTKVKKQLDHGDMVGKDKLGEDGGTNDAEAPSAESSDGKVSVAGAVGVNIATSRAHAYVPNLGSVSAGGELTLRASNNTDASAKADGSTTGDASVGVGVGIALNIGVAEAVAYIGSGATVSSVGLRLEATMTDVEGDSKNEFAAESTSGAGSDKVGVAGSLSINIARSKSEAAVRSGASVSAGGGGVEFRAASESKSTAKAMTKKDGTSGSSVGVGASVAINIAKSDSIAEVRSGVSITGVGSFVLNAKGAHEMSTEGEAGSSSSGVGVAGAIGISIANSTTVARLKDGGTLTTTGSVTLKAEHKGSTTTTAKGSTKAGNVGVGVGLALTVANDYAVATTEREIDSAGAVTFEAHASGKSSAEGTAAAEGAKDNDSTSEDVNAQVDKQLDHGDKVGKDNLGDDGGTNDAKPADASTSDGGVTVGAAIGVNIGVSRAHAFVPDGGVVTAGGKLTLSASNNTDATAKGDGSTTGDAAVGVGAGVALNVGTSEALAYIGSGATVSSVGLRAEALMTDVDGDTKSEFGAESTSGAGSENVGVAGSVAINITANRSEALIKSGATITAGGGAVELVSVNTSSSSAKALTKGLGAVGAKVGVGASAALNVVANLSRAQLDEGTTLTGVGDLSLSATGTHTTDTEAAAGSKSKVAVSPAVAIAIPVSRSEALIKTTSALNISGALTVSSKHEDTVATKAQGDANADGKGTGVGVSASIAVVVSTARAELHGSVDAQGDVAITAETTVSSAVEGNASAIGAPDVPGTEVDQELSRKLAYGDSDIEPPSVEESIKEAGDANFDKTGKTIATVGVAAAFSVNVVTSKAGRDGHGVRRDHDDRRCARREHDEHRRDGRVVRQRGDQQELDRCGGRAQRRNRDEPGADRRLGAHRGRGDHDPCGHEPGSDRRHQGTGIGARRRDRRRCRGIDRCQRHRPHDRSQDRRRRGRRGAGRPDHPERRRSPRPRRGGGPGDRRQGRCRRVYRGQCAREPDRIVRRDRCTGVGDGRHAD